MEQLWVPRLAPRHFVYDEMTLIRLSLVIYWQFATACGVRLVHSCILIIEAGFLRHDYHLMNTTFR
jgi:hypothetical protein